MSRAGRSETRSGGAACASSPRTNTRIEPAWGDDGLISAWSLGPYCFSRGSLHRPKRRSTWNQRSNSLISAWIYGTG
jgi:hypothetical protein